LSRSASAGAFRSALAGNESDGSSDGDGRQSQGQGSLVGYGREVDGQHQRRHEQDGEDAPEGVNRIRRLVDVGGHELERQVQGHDPAAT
jgi:hypothetical protein